MLKFLVNTIADDASAAGVTTGTLDSDYIIEDMMFGHRCRYVRSQSSGGAGNSLEFSYTSLNNPPKAVDHIVIARADKLITAGGVVVQPQEKNSGGTWSNLGSSWTVASADLIGHPQGRRTYGQDYVFAVTSAQEYGYRLKFTTSAADEAIMFSKLYFCESFDFGFNPSVADTPSWENIEARIKPLYGTKLYDTSAYATLTWEGVTRAQIDALRALPHILEHPIFLYEASSSVLKYDIEHVLIQSWKELYIDNDIWDIEITFARLRHYE